jgi:hypothetical protein
MFDLERTPDNKLTLKTRLTVSKSQFIEKVSKLLIWAGKHLRSNKKIEKLMQREAAFIQQQIDSHEERIISELKDLNKQLMFHARNYGILKQRLHDVLIANNADDRDMTDFGEKTYEFETTAQQYVDNILISADREISTIKRNLKNLFVITKQ